MIANLNKMKIFINKFIADCWEVRCRTRSDPNAQGRANIALVRAASIMPNRTLNFIPTVVGEIAGGCKIRKL